VTVRPTPILLTPGPTPIPPEVQAAMAVPMPHHRTREFKAVYGAVLEKLRRVYRTEHDVLMFTASGTGAFESAYANLLSPGDRVLCVSGGNFGDRWIAMAKGYGAAVTELRVPASERPDVDQVVAAIEADPGLALVVVVHSETSTGSVTDIQAIAERTRGRDALLVIDAVSSLGAAPLETDAWGLDVVVTGSQKAFMCPPGLAFASVSPRAWERVERATSPRFYFDWKRTRKAQVEGPQSPYTPAITLVLGLDAALDMILEEGLEASWARTVELGGKVRRRVREMGLGLFSPDDPACSLVTAISVPEDVDGDGVRKALADRHGIVVAGGQGALVGKIWRTAQFGAITERDLRSGLDALALELAAAR
jgi:aspartate aminotransferase-like enzyme